MLTVTKRPHVAVVVGVSSEVGSVERAVAKLKQLRETSAASLLYPYYAYVSRSLVHTIRFTCTSTRCNGSRHAYRQRPSAVHLPLGPWVPDGRRMLGAHDPFHAQSCYELHPTDTPVFNRSQELDIKEEGSRHLVCRERRSE